jgi:hypothetical protein
MSFRVLIADPDPLRLSAYRLLLVGQDIDLDTASTAPACREALERQPPDLLARAQHFLADVAGLQEEGQRLARLSNCPVERGQVVQAGGVVGVALAQRLLADVARLQVEGQRLAVLSHLLVERGQVVQAAGVVRVPRAQRLAIQSAGHPVAAPGFPVVVQGVVLRPQVEPTEGRLGVCLTQ